MTAARFASACVASPHRLASESGAAVLRAGGNAVDAAVATNLTLAVVTPYHCGVGGDLFAMIWDGRALHGYNGSGRAPARADLDLVLGVIGQAQMPLFGAHTVTVPGAVEGWFTLLQRFGSRSFTEVASDALRYAREGIVVSPLAAAYLARARTLYEGEDEWQRIYGGLEAGDRMRQPELAETIETLCERGPDAFYRGEIAEAIARTLAARGGLVRVDDLAAHRGDWVEPLRARYRDVDVAEMPPNTQGVTALEALRIADGLPTTAPESVERQHLLIEAVKLALADRDTFVGDPRAMPFPPDRLLSDEWVQARRAAIDPARARNPLPGRIAGGGTAFLCAADADGMLVSLIQSNWVGFGSGITVPGWGINLHNRGNLFSLERDHANAIAPGKRPLHTLIPAMAFRDARPWLAFGTMGGDGQAQTHVQLLTRFVDDGRDVQDAIDAPRWVVSPATWSVIAEDRFGDAVVEGLRARGHRVAVTAPLDPVMGHAHAIAVADDGYVAASDPRSEGAALGL